MKMGDHEVQRIHGELTLELADGREGTIEVELDVSGLTTIGVDNEYDSSWGTARRPVRPSRTTYSLQVQSPMQADPTFVVRLPVE